MLKPQPTEAEIILDTLMGTLDWDDIFVNYDLSSQFIEENWHNFDWVNIFFYKKIIENLIERIDFENLKIDKLIFKNKNTNMIQLPPQEYLKGWWGFVSQQVKLSEDFMIKYQDYLDWHLITNSQPLTEEFIRKMIHKINWDMLSYWHNISEDFIREFQEKLNWEIMLECRIFSKEFEEEFKDKINFNVKKDWDFLLRYPNNEINWWK